MDEELTSVLKIRRKKAYNFIKQRIFMGQYKPGQALVENKIGKFLQTSRTPVREALQTLAHEKLVKILPGKGAFVTELSLKRLQDIFEVRELIEPKAAEKAASNISEDDLSMIENKLLSVSLDGNFDLVYLTKLWDELHNLILHSVGNEILREVVLKVTAELNIICLNDCREPQNMKKFHQQHIEIVKALKKRNGAEAKRKMQEHILKVRDSLLRRVPRRW